MPRPRPPRQRIGEAGPVREVLPVWRGGDVAWSEEAVVPDAALDALLDDVTAAAAWLDARDGRDDAVADGELWPAAEAAWRAAERRFNRRILAAEMVAAAAEPRLAADSNAGSLLALLRSFPEYVLAAAASSAEQGSLSRAVTFQGGFDAGPPAMQAICVDCRASFDIAAGELRFLQQKGFDLPRRCKPCRERRKAARPKA